MHKCGAFCLFSCLTLAISYFLSTYIGPYSHPKGIHFYNLIYNLSYIINAHIILFNHINTHTSKHYRNKHVGVSLLYKRKLTLFMLFWTLLFPFNFSWKSFQVDWDCSNSLFLNDYVEFHDLHELCNLSSPAPLDRKCFFPYGPLESTLGAESGSAESSFNNKTSLLLNLPLRPHCPDQGFVDPPLMEKTQNSLAFLSIILPVQPLWDDHRLATVVHIPEGKDSAEILQLA